MAAWLGRRFAALRPGRGRHAGAQDAAALLRAVADSSPDAIFAKDVQGRYLLVNDAAARFMGVSPADALALDDEQVFGREIAVSIRANDLAVMQLDHPQTFEECVPTLHGDRYFKSIKGPLRRDGRLLGMFGISRDITEERRAVEELRAHEAALHVSEQRFRLAAAGGHVWDWDLGAGTVSVAPGFWQTLGLVPPVAADALALLEQVMHPQDRTRWRAVLRAHLVERLPYRLDFRARDANGGWRHFRTQGQAIWDAQGRASYMAGTTFDVTEQHLAEEELLRSREELAELSRALMEQEQRTGRQLAQALHDHLGQTLASARLHLDVALNASTQPPVPALSRAAELLDSALADVREVLGLLRPPLLEPLGLAASLETEVARCGLIGVEGLFDASAPAREQRWPEPVEYAVFMIGREAIANALTHATPSRVAVLLAGDAESLRLCVDDDGCGIVDADRGGRAGRLGIVGMRERARAIGAQLAVEPLPQGGTRVRLDWQRQPK